MTPASSHQPGPIRSPSGSVVEAGQRLVFLKVGFRVGQPAVTPAVAVGRGRGFLGLLFAVLGAGPRRLNAGVGRPSGSAERAPHGGS